MNWALLINVLAAVGGLAGLSSFLNIYLSKNKVRAEAADIEQNVSDKVLKNVRDDNSILKAERDQMRIEINKVREEFDQFRQKMSQYEIDQYDTRMLVVRLINWSRTAYDELVSKGSSIDGPPTGPLLEKFKDSK